MASFMFNISKGLVGDWAADSFKVRLYQTSVMVEATEQDAATVAGLTAAFIECTATGYTAGGYALASKTRAQDTGNNRIDHNAAQLTISGLGNGTNNTLYGALIVIPVGGAGTDIPVAALDFDTPVTTDSNDIIIKFNNAAPGTLFRGA